MVVKAPAFLFTAALACGFTLISRAQSTSNLVTDGNFASCADGSSAPPGWIFIGQAQYDTCQTIDGISVFAFGDVDTSGVLSQTLATVSGADYAVSFDLATLTASEQCDSTTSAFSVSIGDTTYSLTPAQIDAACSTDDVAAGQYETISLTFTATAATSTLTFEGNNNVNYFYLTNVIVSGQSSIGPSQAARHRQREKRGRIAAGKPQPVPSW